MFLLLVVDSYIYCQFFIMAYPYEGCGGGIARERRGIPWTDKEHIKNIIDVSHLWITQIPQLTYKPACPLSVGAGVPGENLYTHTQSAHRE